MKKTNLLVVMITIAISLLAQTPQAFKYQAIARNNLGDPILNQYGINPGLLTGRKCFRYCCLYRNASTNYQPIWFIQPGDWKW